MDEVIGLDSEQRMTDDAVACIYNEAADTTYRRGGEGVSYSDAVSSQTVKNKLHETRFPKEKKPKEKRRVKRLYIEADEDHVSLQFKEKKGDLIRNESGRKNNTAIAKIVYVHEGAAYDAPKSSRRHLVNVHYFGGLYPGEENRLLWKEVGDYIDSHYEQECIEKIYLSSDCGTWIDAARDYLPGIIKVLDEFHLSKYLIKITAFLEDSAWDARQSLRKAILDNNKESFDLIIKEILGYCEKESSVKRIKESAKYIRSNWEAAVIRLQREKAVPGCSAEGHVSHVFSARMSSRPMGWSRKGVDQMCRLRIYIKNGGDLLELAKYQRISRVDNEEVNEAVGFEGLSCKEILKSERNKNPQIGKYVESMVVGVSTQIAQQSWYKGISRQFSF